MPQFHSWDPSPDQADALDALLSWWRGKESPHITLGGLAGTGKSSLIGHLSNVILEEAASDTGGLSIGFATLTGKASKVLESSLLAREFPVHDGQHYVGTIHRLMYLPVVSESGAILRWDRKTTLPYDLLVIDEASMVSQNLWQDLCSYGIPIIAVGDHGQLPPVGEDCGLMNDPVLRLEKIHRQAEGNPIIHLSTLIRSGASLRTLREFIQSDGGDALHYDNGGLADVVDFIDYPGLIITFTNASRQAANKMVRRMTLKKGDPQIGDAVICVRNAYLDDLFLANGSRGALTGIKPVKDHWFDCEVRLDDGMDVSFLASRHQFGREKTISDLMDLEDEVDQPFYGWQHVGVLLDYGYALTAHKSQGSQASSVAVLLEPALRVLDADTHTRWLYTAVTRSTERLLIAKG